MASWPLSGRRRRSSHRHRVRQVPGSPTRTPATWQGARGTQAECVGHDPELQRPGTRAVPDEADHLQRRRQQRNRGRVAGLPDRHGGPGTALRAVHRRQERLRGPTAGSAGTGTLRSPTPRSGRPSGRTTCRTSPAAPPTSPAGSMRTGAAAATSRPRARATPRRTAACRRRSCWRGTWLTAPPERSRSRSVCRADGPVQNADPVVNVPFQIVATQHGVRPDAANF